VVSGSTQIISFREVLDCSQGQQLMSTRTVEMYRGVSDRRTDRKHRHFAFSRHSC